jgi:hypothetical protein
MWKYPIMQVDNKKQTENDKKPDVKKYQKNDVKK